MSRQNKNTEFSKTFQIVGYNDKDTSESKEDFTAELTGKPTNVKERVTSETNLAIVDLGGQHIEFEVRNIHIPDRPDEFNGTYSDWLGTTFENFKHDEHQNGTGRLRFETRTNSSMKPKCSIHSALSGMIDDVVDELDIHKVSPNLEYSHISRRWVKEDTGAVVDNDSKDVVRISSFGVDKQRILSKEVHRSADDMYQTLAEYPCLVLLIEMSSSTDGVFDTWNEEIITPIHKWLAGNPAISVVRYTECEVSETRKGECYNI